MAVASAMAVALPPFDDASAMAVAMADESPCKDLTVANNILILLQTALIS